MGTLGPVACLADMRVARRLGFVLGLGCAVALAGCIQHDANDELPEDTFDARAEPRVPEVSHSLQLTATDGTGLRLVELHARGAVQAPLAFTELHLTFENPEDRVLEGRFSIELPPRSALSRFAMKIDDAWQEGEVVERKKARLTYDRYLHKNVDPALLEKSAGNRFSAKVFPIPARGRKELVLSYSQELGAPTEPYRLPLVGLPELEQLQTEFFIDEPGAQSVMQRRVLRTQETDIRPTKDLVIPTRATKSVVGLRHGRHALARVIVEGSTDPEPIGSMTVAFDTSASRALGYGNAVAQFGQLLAALAKQEPGLVVDVLAFDQDVEEVFHGRASEFGQADLETLLSRRALGASNLGRLLRDSRIESPRLLIVTDGIATAGETQLAELTAALSGLGQRGVKRMDAIVDETGGSDEVMAGLAVGSLTRGGTVSSSAMELPALVQRLTRSVLPSLSVEVPGASEHWPKELVGRQPGDAVVVYASFAEALEGPVHVLLRGESGFETKVPTHVVPGPLLSRSVASAQIDALTKEHSASSSEDERAALRERIVTHSVAHRVISDFTAMLVLESEADYARFDIDRTAELELLTVGRDGVVLSTGPRTPPLQRPQRSGFAASIDGEAGAIGRRGAGGAGILGLLSQDSGHFLASPNGAAFAVGDDDVDVWGGLAGNEIGEAFGVGGLGIAADPLIGVDRIFESLPSGTPEGAKGEPASGPRRLPVVRQRRPKVKGDMSADIIHRVARIHLNEIRGCYNAGLLRSPKLRGRVKVQFQIAPPGKVNVSVVQSSTLPDKAVANCMQAAVRRWRYPRTADGSVVVSIAYDLSSKPARTHRTPKPPPRPLTIPRPLTPLTEESAYDLAKVDEELSPPLAGQMAAIGALIEQDLPDAALQLAFEWRDASPTDVMALVALGEALEAVGKRAAAARVYGSLIDLSPSDAPQLRYAASRLQALGKPWLPLAIATLERAVEERPDHPTSHRKLAYALLEEAHHEAAFDAIVVGARRVYAERYRGVRHVFSDDVGIIAAAWAAHAKDPAAARRKIAAAGVQTASTPSTHFVLSWETDANDIDLRIYDGDGHIAYYARKGMVGGGQIYGDVTDGYGPESFTIPKTAKVYPYRIDANFFDRGPSGYGLGALQVVQHDGHGGVRSQLVPYVLMNDGGTVRLHQLEGPLGGGH